MEPASSRTYSSSVAYHNGRVFTVSKQQDWAQGFVVNNLGVFETIGSNEEILSIARKRGLVKFNLQGHFVMPGIHDAHAHLYFAGLAYLSESSLDLEQDDLRIAEKIQHGQCICSHTGAQEDWIVGNSYLSVHFPNGTPDRQFLDTLFPDRPVVIRELSGHKLLVNSEALRRLSVEESTPDPVGGCFMRRKDGTLSGEVSESAMEVVWSRLPLPPMAHFKRSLEHAFSICHSYGITSSQEATASTAYLHALKELEDENRLTLDVYTHIVSSPGGIVGEPEESLAALIDIAEGFRSKHVHPQFIKFLLDGAPISPNFTQADLDAQGLVDPRNLVVSQETLSRRLKVYDSRGLTCKIHATGEGSVRMALNAIEEVRTANKEGPRHEIAHCNAVHPDDVRRFAPLRVTAEMSPAIFHLDDMRKANPKYFQWDFSGMLATGALTTIGSDWLVVATPNVLTSIANLAEPIGANMRGSGGDGLTDIQRGSRALISMITIGGAEMIGAKTRTGSIEVGKHANFIALDSDLSEGQFREAKVLQTWFEGRIVYSARHDGRLSL